MFGLLNAPQAHQYYVFSTGTTLKNRTFNTRRDAEIYMYTYCNKNNIHVECTEDDKHEKKYVDCNNNRCIEFYINRI